MEFLAAELGFGYYSECEFVSHACKSFYQHPLYCDAFASPCCQCCVSHACDNYSLDVFNVQSYMNLVGFKQ